MGNGRAELSKIHLDVLDPDVLQHCLTNRIRKRLEQCEPSLRHDVGDSTDDGSIVDRVRKVVAQRGTIHVVGEDEVDLEGLRSLLLARKRTMVTENAKSSDLHLVRHSLDFSGFAVCVRTIESFGATFFTGRFDVVGAAEAGRFLVACGEATGASVGTTRSATTGPAARGCAETVPGRGGVRSCVTATMDRPADPI